MGVHYELICKTCKRRVELIKDYGTADAFRGTARPFNSSDRPQGYRAFIAIAFMRRHWGHQCEVVSDHDESGEYMMNELEDVLRPPAQT